MDLKEAYIFLLVQLFSASRFSVTVLMTSCGLWSPFANLLLTFEQSRVCRADVIYMHVLFVDRGHTSVELPCASAGLERFVITKPIDTMSLKCGV